jgi:hypothetical protein
MRRKARLPLPLLLITLVLAGCTQPDPMPTPPPTPSASPVFASDEEALAAAEEAYGKYLAAADEVINDGGSQPERILEFVSEDLYEQELAGYKRLSESGWHGVGNTVFSLTLQQYDNKSVVVYACDDLGATDIVDQEGVSVVKPGRVLVVPYEVEFDPTDSMRLIRKEVWEGLAC